MPAVGLITSDYILRVIQVIVGGWGGDGVVGGTVILERD